MATLKKIAYWAYLSRQLTGRLSGSDQWLLGFGPIWTTLLPIFSLAEYSLAKASGRMFDWPWHIILSGVTSIVIAIGCDYIEERKQWGKEFARVPARALEGHLRISAAVAIAGFILYVVTILVLWDEMRA